MRCCQQPSCPARTRSCFGYLKIRRYAGTCADPDLPAGGDLRSGKALCTRGRDKVLRIQQNRDCVGETLISVAEGAMWALPPHVLKTGNHRSRTIPGEWPLSEAMFARGESSFLGVSEDHCEVRVSEAGVAREREGAACTLLMHDLKSGSQRCRTNLRYSMLNSYQSVPEAEIPASRLDKVCMRAGKIHAACNQPGSPTWVLCTQGRPIPPPYPYTEPPCSKAG